MVFATIVANVNIGSGQCRIRDYTIIANSLYHQTFTFNVIYTIVQ